MEYAKNVTPAELDREIELEIARREHIQNHMADLPKTYRDKLPRPTGGFSDLTAAEQAIRHQFQADQQYLRDLQSSDPVISGARSLK